MLDARRLLVWDVKGEWAEWPEVIAARSWSALRVCLKDGDAYAGAPGRFAFVPPAVDAQSFELFAGAAHAWGAAAPCVVVAEELPDVTGQGKARSEWGRMLRQGLGKGITLYALTQSPAESDKTTLRNATRVHTGRLGWQRDRAYMAELLDADLEIVAGLVPLEYLERDAAGGLYRGRLAFASSGRAHPTKPATLRPPKA